MLRDRSEHRPWTLRPRIPHALRRPQLTGNASVTLPVLASRPRRPNARKSILTPPIGASLQGLSHSSRAAAHRNRLLSAYPCSPPGRDEPVAGDQSGHRPQMLASRAPRALQRPRLTRNASVNLPVLAFRPRRTNARSPTRTPTIDASSHNYTHSSKAAAHRNAFCQLTRACLQAAKDQWPETNPDIDHRR